MRFARRTGSSSEGCLAGRDSLAAQVPMRTEPPREGRGSPGPHACGLAGPVPPGAAPARGTHRSFFLARRSGASVRTLLASAR
jgi:hypothetical protein